MNKTMTKYDPWGPIAATLYAINNSDLVYQSVLHTGATVNWPVLDERSSHSHLTRIRAYQPAIDATYRELSGEEQGQFAQAVLKRLLASNLKEGLKSQLLDGLQSIGWTFATDGTLTTQDALISERFFAAGTQYDAYFAIREILEAAITSVVIVDAYMGSSLFTTLRALRTCIPSVELLTTADKLKADFVQEAKAFQKQFTETSLKVRTAAHFHDRFIAVDGSAYYHVGASIKDAGTRAFLISKLEDAPVVAALSQYMKKSWDEATVLI